MTVKKNLKDLLSMLPIVLFFFKWLSQMLKLEYFQHLKHFSFFKTKLVSHCRSASQIYYVRLWLEILRNGFLIKIVGKTDIFCH